VPSGNLQLKGLLWKPNGSGPFPIVLFNHGSGGADADHTAGLPMTEAAEKLAPLFLKHGYAFLYLFRRGQGLSGDQGPFMQDILQCEETTKGKQARQHLQYMLATTDHLDDVMAALSFLKTAPAIDAKRIAIAGHSFGGQVTLLAAERDNTLRAAVTFAAAAGSWERSPELRERLRSAAEKDNGSDHAGSGGKRLQHSAESRVGRRTSPSAQIVRLKNLSTRWSNIRRRAQFSLSRNSSMGARRLRIS
jgi:carboxymethylenebutenolidase